MLHSHIAQVPKKVKDGVRKFFPVMEAKSPPNEILEPFHYMKAWHEVIFILKTHFS